jgi:hypothetical protein
MFLTGSSCAVFAQTTQDTVPLDRRAMDTIFSSTESRPVNRSQGTTGANPGTTSGSVGTNQSGTWNNNQTGTGSLNDDQPTTNTSTGNYSAYNANAYSNITTVPSYIQYSFTQAYPMANNVSWQQSTDWYRATYLVNGRNMHVYYGPNGSSYALALPVIQSYVPEEVISKAMSMHGNNLYSITGGKSVDGQEIYHVTLMDNGETRTEWMSADGSTVANAYRTDDANAALDPSMNNGQMNNNQQMNNGQLNSNGNQMNNGQLNNSTNQMNNGQLNNSNNQMNQSTNNGTGTLGTNTGTSGTELNAAGTTGSTTGTNGTTGTTGTSGTTGTTGTTGSGSTGSGTSKKKPGNQ